MMRKTGIAVLIAFVLMLATAVGAYAITNGELDGGRHPYVDCSSRLRSGAGWRCRALISPTVVLTAGIARTAPSPRGSGSTKMSHMIVSPSPVSLWGPAAVPWRDPHTNPSYRVAIRTVVATAFRRSHIDALLS
jgi:hypothetical protein